MRKRDSFSAAGWGSLTDENYKAVRKAKPEVICRNSVVTKVLVIVSQLAGILLAESVQSPHLAGVEIEINTYPYVYNDAEADDIIRAVVSRLGTLYSVRLVHFPLKTLTTDFVRERYLCMFMYDTTEWINLHVKDIKSFKLKNFTIYTPRINHGRELTEQEQTEVSRYGLDLCSFTKEVFLPFIILEFLPVAMFCALIPENKDEYLKL